MLFYIITCVQQSAPILLHPAIPLVTPTYHNVHIPSHVMIRLRSMYPTDFYLYIYELCKFKLVICNRILL